VADQLACHSPVTCWRGEKTFVRLLNGLLSSGKENIMKLTTVESSMIHAVGYDAKTRTLEVVFNSGKTYQYYDVPQGEYDGLLAASSKGSYMRACIIDVYECALLRRRRR
jgi:hypothetical protein